jgi:crotonobetainyl-CoA:carnitine CoA-transferase CaiB-like acyl-CoA transferase
VGGDFLEHAWRSLGGDPALLDLVNSHGEAALASTLAVGALALGAVGAQCLAAQELAALPKRPGQPVVLDAGHVGIAFRSERFLRVAGRPAGAGFAPLSRFLPTVDGWVRLHANYRHHQQAALRALGPDPAAAARERTSVEIEDAIVAAGGVAAAVRTPQQWAQHPQGAAVAAQPLLRLQQVAAGPQRARRLGGLRVLDLTRVIAGPVGTRTLASYGADVLRVDSPRLPEDASTLLETGGGKRHTQLDLADRGDRQRLEELLTGADVLVNGYRPRALARYGLSRDALAERFPALVVVTLSAWGDRGPWNERRGFDSIVQAATGIADATRSADGEPGVLPAQALDHGTGHLLAASVIRALTSMKQHGGTWHAQLSLAQLAHWLLATPQQPSDSAPSIPPDARPYLIELPSPAGSLTVVRPPCSPDWTHGPLPVRCEYAEWTNR